MSATPPAEPWSYFRECIGEKYTPAHYGLHEATHPVRVREVMAEFAGTKAADVIAALVRAHESDQQRLERLLADVAQGRQA